MIEIKESKGRDGLPQEERVLAEVDKEKEKQAAKEASEKAKAAKEAKIEAEKQEKEATQAKEKAEAAKKAATDAEAAEKAAEAAREAKEEALEAEEARADAEAKAAEAEEAKAEAESAESEAPPPEDNDGGVDEDDNVTPYSDFNDPWAEEEERKKQAERDYAAGKGKLDCYNPLVQCMNADVEVSGKEDVLKVSVPISKGGIDCRFSNCMDSSDINIEMESATKLINTIHDICTYSECLLDDDMDLKGLVDDCSRFGVDDVPFHIPEEIDNAIYNSMQNGGPGFITFKKAPFKSKSNFNPPTDFRRF
ncbi:MAG: hypothetical protein EOP48_08110 [Sphingobacteriales bacterium]|nr:MAG: hypothetical protein EOP48_08110 [Sphingobacteriales bacterium]